MHDDQALTGAIPVISFPRIDGRVRAASAISFEAVCFNQGHAGPELLKDISLEVEPGQMVALTGPAGAGKSCCAHLLRHPWEIAGGAIHLDGRDIRNLSLAALNDLVAVVPQACMLRHERLRDNFAFTRPDASVAELEAAARQAQVHEAIMHLPQGYDTPYEAWNERLSAGERQRVALACALLKKTPVLVVDETLSALTLTDERAWQAALMQIRPGRTLLVISRRLSTLRQADWIVVLEQGVVVEEGRHDQLMAWHDRYARLIAAQMA
ncbi:MAG: ATP-binding cassette domain-containing protein [Asticcacaulis sp.]|uniref:ATP-binding cassette domain-containing protein n=1 Tax=Asticcacaulis sp. TaxID=1872648 RepID=UPI0039E2C608